MDRLKILKKAKEIFNERNGYWGMCICIEKAYYEIGGSSLPFNYRASDIIPKFNREFVEAPRDRYDKAYWWPATDRKPRIKAFNKLIHYYEVNGQGEL